MYYINLAETLRYYLYSLGPLNVPGFYNHFFSNLSLNYANNTFLMRPLAFCNVVVYITHSEIMTGWPNKNSTSGAATPSRINLNEEVNVIMPRLFF